MNAPLDPAQARQQLLALRLRQGRQAGAADAVPQRPPNTQVPLSSAQQGLWFLDQLMGPNGLYNSARAFHLAGPLDMARLRRAVQALLQRHESLRTACVFANVDVRQQVCAAEMLPSALHLEPALDGGAATPLAWLDRLQPLALKPFDLAQPPLFRVHVLPVHEQQHLLLLVLHHVVSDGWSMGLALTELGALYAADGDASGLPPLPVQYADFALWQQRRLQSPELQRQLAYWRGQLRDLSALSLPGDAPRPARCSYRGAQCAFTLEPDTLAQLKALARRENVTLFMLLLAVFQVLLARHAGQDEVAVGVPVAGRNRPELEGLIGYFVNTLVMRTRLGGNPQFAQLLAAVRQTALNAYENQELPFDQLVAELQPQRDLSRNPLYQVAFALQNHPRGALALPGLQVQPVTLPASLSKFDLTLTLTESADGLDVVWEYARDLFEPATVQRMHQHFQRLLIAVLQDAAQPVMQLPMLPDDERKQLLVRWNQTAVPYPSDLGLHQLFEHQALRRPQSTAITMNGEALSYCELDARAARLAARLARLGVGPEHCVVVCMQRSLELPVALLAVLKAGGVYVPMDPELPPQRLHFMAQDCAAAVVLVDAAQAAAFDGLPAALLVTSEWAPDVLAGDDRPTAVAVQPQQLAYVIYTSGSTGQPKGVQISHRAICNHIPWISDTLALRTSDRLLQKTSIGFDASVLEFFAPWYAGACVVLSDPLGARDLVALARQVSEAGITVLQLVPTVLKALLGSGIALDWPGLRCLVCGGEALEGQLLAQLRARLPHLQVFNFYGPTETAIDAVAFAIPPGYATTGRVPIGKPVANLQVYVLDAWLQPVPIGVVGEIMVGGMGLARGYLNQPALTARSFIPHPFEPGERLYRTGDLGRWLDTGLLECWGRNDGQVKLRGQRIELGEIEALLAGHPGVAQAAVLLHQPPERAPMLVAYVQPREALLAPADLRQHLRQRLPESMLPQQFIAVTQMPVLSNGKVDRSQLPALQPGATAFGAKAEPADELERTLCRIWQQVLGVDLVAPDDNFFELGGHSLLAAQVFAHSSAVLKKTLPLGTLFQAPTVRELARFYREDVAAVATPTCLVTITGGDGTGRPPLFVVPGIYGNVVSLSALARELGAEQPFHGLQSVGLDGLAPPFETVEEMAANYVQALRAAQPQGPYRLLGICFGGVVAFEMMRQLRGSGQVVAFLGLVDPSSQGGDMTVEPVRQRPSRAGAAWELARFARGRLRLYAAEMRGLGWGARLRYMLAKARHVSRAAAQHDLLHGINTELLQDRVTRANVRALKRYQRAAVAADPRMVVAIVRAKHRVAKPGVPQLDWVQLTGGAASQHTLPGKDTGDLLLANNAKGLAQVLTPYLSHGPG